MNQDLQQIQQIAPAITPLIPVVQQLRDLNLLLMMAAVLTLLWRVTDGCFLSAIGILL